MRDLEAFAYQNMIRLNKNNPFIREGVKMASMKLFDIVASVQVKKNA